MAGSLFGSHSGMADDGKEVADLNGTLCGTNMVFRADVFRKINGFLPELGPGVIGLGEETELNLRMRKAGCRLLYAPQVLIWHRLSRKRLTSAFIRQRFFQQGRAQAYYVRLPAPLLRFGLWVVKETIVNEVAAIGQLCAGRPALALRSQCEARSHAGFFGSTGSSRGALADWRIRCQLPRLNSNRGSDHARIRSRRKCIRERIRRLESDRGMNVH
jgi:GT2 family glycosyltransferase